MVDLFLMFLGLTITGYGEVFTGTFPYVPEYPPQPPVADHVLQLNLPRDGDLQVTITTAATLGFNMGTMGFYDSDRTTRIKQFATGKGTTDVQVVNGLRRGTYYLIFHPSSLSYGDYLIETVPYLNPIANDVEPNDALALAQPVEPGEKTFGHIGYSWQQQPYDRHDYWEFILPQDGELDNEFEVPFNFLVAEIASADGTVLASGLVEAGSKTLLKLNPPHLKAGTYHLCLHQGYPGVSFGGYGFKLMPHPAPCKNDTESNDTPQTAMPIALNSMAEGHLGYVHGESGEVRSDLVDWWSFNHPTTGDLQIEYQTTTNLPFIVEIFRQDTDQRVFSNSGDIGTTGTFIAKNLSAGLYRVRLGCYRWNWGAYTFRLLPANPKAPWTQWVSDHFTAAEIAAGQLPSPTADPDGDRMNNLVEFALGLDPRQANLPAACRLSVDLSTDAQGILHPALVFDRPSDRLNSVSYSIWYSDNLSPPRWNRLFSVEENVVLKGDWQTIRLLDPDAMGALPTRFYRLGLELKQ